MAPAYSRHDGSYVSTMHLQRGSRASQYQGPLPIKAAACQPPDIKRLHCYSSCPAPTISAVAHKLSCVEIDAYILKCNIEMYLYKACKLQCMSVKLLCPDMIRMSMSMANVAAASIVTSALSGVAMLASSPRCGSNCGLVKPIPQCAWQP